MVYRLINNARSNKSTFNVGLVSVKYSLNWCFIWSRFFLAPHSVLMFACRYILIMVYRSHTAHALIGKKPGRVLSDYKIYKKRG